MLKIALICVFLMGLTQGKRLQRVVAADGLPIRKWDHAYSAYVRTIEYRYHRWHIKYMIVEKDMDRHDSEEACQRLGGTLATPSNSREFNFLESHMQDKVLYHLGAQCKDCTLVDISRLHDKWKWSTGKPLSWEFGWGYKNGRSLYHSSEDAIYLFAYKEVEGARAYIINYNGKKTGHAICQCYTTCVKYKHFIA